MGWAIIDYTSTPLRLSHSYVRDEALQARELIDQLTVLDRQRINGAFVMTFTTPTLTHDQRAEFDLDMASYSLVKSYDNRLATTYPGMPWDPKQSFGALADYFAPDRVVASERVLP